MQLCPKIPERFVSFFLVIFICLFGNFIAFKVVNIPDQFEVVLLFALINFYPVIRVPQAGVYLLFIIMPLIPFFRRLYYLQYSRPAADPLIIIGDILIVFITAGLYFEFRKQKEENNNYLKLNSWILVYFVYLILRIFFFNILPLPEAVMKFRFYGPAVILFFVGVLFGKKISMLKNIWSITIVLSVAAALYGISQLLFGYTDFEKLWFSSISFSTLFIKGIARPFSFFQSPAAFADYMLLGIISVVIIFGMAEKRKPYHLLGLVPLFIGALLITSVRSNWIGAIVIIFLWVLITRFRTLKQRYWLLQVFFLLFFLFQFVEVYLTNGNNLSFLSEVVNGKTNKEYFNLLVKQRVSALSNPFDEHSFVSRLALWKIIISSTADPVMAFLGRGVGGLAADSLYFTYLAEFGYPGLIFIIIVTVIFIVNGFYVIDKSTNSSVVGIARGITIMNIAFGIINITGTHIHGFPGDIYYWFWNGVITCHVAAIKTEQVKLADENIGYN